MSSKPENPPAFTGKSNFWHTVMRDGIEINEPYYNQGMTLRDYFAGQALTSLVVGENTKKIRTELEYTVRMEAVAEIAYEYADAMLKAREAV